MGQQKFPVRLTQAERNQLHEIVQAGERPAHIVRRARILLWSEDGLSDREICLLLGCDPLTVATTRERWAKTKRLEDRQRYGSQRMLNAEQEAALLALASSPAPEGRPRWTYQLLADKLIEMQVVPYISDETVRRTLKKLAQTPAEPPPEAQADPPPPEE
ncbi:MAG: helix-turn-helix domain-containing protein [Anaerolineae bacterium]|nr:helix-turn-helix domain-containing protein [Anaerolineae bacterium]